MKNLTITADERVVRWAKIRAAQQETSVSRMVGEMLRERMEQEEGYEEAMRRFLATKPAVLSRSGRYPTREEIHDRNGVR